MKLLHKVGCPDKMIAIIRPFHDCVMGHVLDSGKHSEPFQITNGAKQDCVLAPTLYGIVFALMIRYAFRNIGRDVYIKIRTDGRFFNLRRFTARINTTDMPICDLPFADDCALFASTLEDIQIIVDCFSDAAKKFGLTTSESIKRHTFCSCRDSKLNTTTQRS